MDHTAAVARAILATKSGLDAPQPVADLARGGMFSRFYFHRIFRETTSMTPARFLAALRMAEARRGAAMAPLGPLDDVPDGYLVGAARGSFEPDRAARAAPQVALRPAGPTDPPVLAITSMRWLVEADHLRPLRAPHHISRVPNSIGDLMRSL